MKKTHCTPNKLVDSSCCCGRGSEVWLFVRPGNESPMGTNVVVVVVVVVVIRFSIP